MTDQREKRCALPTCENPIQGPPSVVARRTYCSRACSNSRGRSDLSVYERRRPGLLMARYGLTVDQFNAMVIAQANRCAICRRDLGEGRGRHVDHDHSTGAVRGLLCVRCNTTLGRVETIGLDRVLAYLGRPYA
jgi:hypothetical protein